MISTVRPRTGGLWISLVSLTTSAAGGASVGSTLPVALADGLVDENPLGDVDGSPDGWQPVASTTIAAMKNTDH
jgi:hypothetical protein